MLYSNFVHTCMHIFISVVKGKSGDNHHIAENVNVTKPLVLGILVGWLVD